MPDWLKFLIACFAALLVGVTVWVTPGYLIGSLISLDFNPADWEVWVRAVAVLASFSAGSAFAIIFGGATFATTVVALDL